MYSQAHAELSNAKQVKANDEAKLSEMTRRVHALEQEVEDSKSRARWTHDESYALVLSERSELFRKAQIM